MYSQHFVIYKLVLLLHSPIYFHFQNVYVKPIWSERIRTRTCMLMVNFNGCIFRLRLMKKCGGWYNSFLISYTYIWRECLLWCLMRNLKIIFIYIYQLCRNEVFEMRWVCYTLTIGSTSQNNRYDVIVCIGVLCVVQFLPLSTVHPI